MRLVADRGLVCKEMQNEMATKDTKIVGIEAKLVALEDVSL